MACHSKTFVYRKLVHLVQVVGEELECEDKKRKRRRAEFGLKNRKGI